MKTKRLKPKIINLHPGITREQVDFPASRDDKLFIGIDNGVTGTIGCIYNNKTWFFKTPTKSEQNYTKKKGNISRVVYGELHEAFCKIINECKPDSIMCLIERPMINPGRFTASISAVRALEATLLVVEGFLMPYQYEDSKAWQKELLPIGSKADQLKKDSVNIGCRLFPQHSELIKKHKDADGILIAEYCRRKF